MDVQGSNCRMLLPLDSIKWRLRAQKRAFSWAELRGAGLRMVWTRPNEGTRLFAQYLLEVSFCRNKSVSGASVDAVQHVAKVAP